MVLMLNKVDFMFKIRQRHIFRFSLVLCFTPAANGHSDCLRMMIDYGEEGDLTNVADKFGQ